HLQVAGGRDHAQPREPSRRAHGAPRQGEQAARLLDYQDVPERRAHGHDGGVRSDQEPESGKAVHAEVLASASRLPLWSRPGPATRKTMDFVAVTAFGIVYTIATLILDTMLATWGLSLGLVGLVTLVFGPTTEGIATPLGHVTVGEYRLSVYSVFVILMAFAVLGLTYGLFNYTRFGLVARATMQNP